MELFSTERARFAANTLLAVEICFGTLSFWSHAFEQGQLVHFVVAFLLTLTFGSISILAAGVIVRAVAAHQAEQKVTGALVAFCGGVVALVGGFMTWHGLTWADAQANLIPGEQLDWLFIPAAAMLSGLNLVAIYVFCRDLKPTVRQPQLVHFPIDGEKQKDPAAQEMARKSWEKRRANG